MADRGLETVKKEECVAVVHVPGTDMVEKEAVLDYAADLPLKCQEFLQAFTETRYVGRASKLAGISLNVHRYWMGETNSRNYGVIPGFKEAYSIALQNVRDQEFDKLGEDNEAGGIKEVMYDGDGILKYTRYRQSEQLRKMRLLALDPERYAGEKQTGTQINIVVVQQKEGW